MNEVFTESWERSWRSLVMDGEGLDLRDMILLRYGEPHRRYHTLQHLEECLVLFDSVCRLPDHPAEVEMALWFHDAVYDLAATDNESRSADLAMEALLSRSAPRGSVDLIRRLILTTMHTSLPQTLDEQVLVDIDLAILGASEERFRQYEHQIREEYAEVPSVLFREKRRTILETFLNRPAIYTTPVFHERFETSARANLAKAIEWNSI